MALSLVSFNFKHTPLALREKLAIPAQQLPVLLRSAREACGLEELMVVSTCNRVEFYLVEEGENGQGGHAVLDWMKGHVSGWDDALEGCAILLAERAALNHLFRVACSLESMVIGEPQILGQVKEGYQAAVEQGALGPQLNALMQKVFHAAKRVRTETDIARFPVSVSYVAAEMATRIFETLQDKVVMVVGAGEMAELVVAHLQKAGIRQLRITNRTFANAVALAERVQGSAVRFEHMADQLAEADIVISSTGSQGIVIDQEMVRQAHRARKGRPMFFIDIAVPRDVDPAVNQLSDVYCYDIDNLQAAAAANHRERENEALRAQRIVEEEVERYVRWKHSETVVPVLKALRTHFTRTGEGELEKGLERLGHLSGQDAAAVRRLVQSILNKLLHLPSTRLKEMGEERNGRLYAEAIAALFGLSSEDGGQAAARSGEPAGAGEEGQDGGRRDAGPQADNVLRLHRSGPGPT